MIDLNIVNFITIGIIAVLFWAGFKYASAMVGFNPSWI